MNYLSKENVQEILNLSQMKESLLAGVASASESQTSGSNSSHVSEVVHAEEVTPVCQVAQVVYRMRGTIEPEWFQQAWDHVIQAHPELRSVYRTMKNRVVQVVLKTRPIPVEMKDLRGISDVETQQVIEELLATYQQTPIDPGEGPLMRLTLVRTGEQEAFFLWTYHALVLDERSCQLVLRDLLAVYGALARGKELPTLARPGYKGYLTWLAEQDWSQVKADWQAQLSAFETATALLEGPRKHVPGGLSKLQTVHLSENVSRLLQDLAQQNNVTAETIVQAAWAMLLNVYSGEENVFYGVTLSGRPVALADADELVGRFKNTLPAHVVVGGDQQVTELLRTVQEQQQFLKKYAYLSLDELRSYRDVPRDATLFESAIGVYEAEEQPLATLGVGQDHSLQMEPVRFGGEMTPLTVHVVLGETWQVVFSTAEKAWETETVRRMQSHFVTLLESIATQPGALVRELNLLPETERQQLFVDFNQMLLPQPNLDLLAHQVIEEQVARRPEAIACIYNGEHLTYAELNARANRLAHWLRAQGFGRDDLAALLAERGSDMLVAIVAVLKAGGAYVPLDAANPDSRLRTIIENCRAKVILTQNGLTMRSQDLARDLNPQPVVFCLDTSTLQTDVPDVQTLQALPSDNPPFQNEPSDLANVFFTSGSTGLPKGAMIEHIGMLNHLYAKINLLGLNENSVVVQNASHCFDISVWQFLAPLMTGGTVAIYGNEVTGDPHALLAAVQRDRATVLEMVPAMIEMFLFAASEGEEQGRALPHLAYMISTGEGLPVPLMHKWLRAYPQVKVVNTYGATECSDDTSHEVVESSQGGAGQNYVTLGKPIPNFKTYLLDRWQRPVPIGCVGEICLTGIGVGRGYLNDPERTAQAFVCNPFDDGMGERMYRTGDLGRYVPSGELLFVSRIDHQVKVRGHRIELGEIESVLRSVPAVQQCVAIVKPDNQGQNRILAYVVGESVSVEELREQLQARLPEYMMPEHLLVLDAMPLNRNGKIDRKALPDPQEADRTVLSVKTARNEIEAQLIQIWQEVLGTSPIGIEDNFFLLGGHSLRTVQVRSRIKQQLGVDVPLKMLFDLQTVELLGAWISKMNGQATGAEQTIPRLPERDFYPLSHSQLRMYHIHQRDETKIASNMPNAFRIEGPLDLRAFRKAWQQLIERQASLRTTFAVVDGQPMQRVWPEREFSFQPRDLSKLEEPAREQAVQKMLRQELKEPFDLERGPLFRVRLLKLEHQVHVLLVNMHHIIGDLWTWQVLQKEFIALYLANVAGEVSPLPPLPIQYVDFAHWQVERTVNGELDVHEQYWLEKLAGPLPELILPTDFERPAVRSYRGSTVQTRLPQALVAEVKGLAAKSDATLFMVLLAATSVFLQRLTGQRDLVLGTPEAGRNRRELEDLIGFFVNRVPLRIAVQPELSFAQLLEQVKHTALEAFEHQEYPCDMLFQKLAECDPNSPTIMKMMCQVIRETKETLLLGDLKMTALPTGLEISKHDLYFGFIESEEELHLVLDYSTELFKRETVERFANEFEMLLTELVGDPEKSIGNNFSTV